jgi:hypothetical protein
LVASAPTSVGRSASTSVGHGGQQIVSAGWAVTDPVGLPPPGAQLEGPVGLAVAIAAWTPGWAVHWPTAPVFARKLSQVASA